MLCAVVNQFISKVMGWFGCAVMLMGCALTTTLLTTIANKHTNFNTENMEDLPVKVFSPFFYLEFFYMSDTAIPQ